ncbi:DUF481 domain-containing protein [Parvularcula marina]|uniref:DUF481 domain-containing protein n=1 Tax=Parvularcula marina TaxID=2292771 RepID=A0A371RI04_9PROT|nr:DUF481 domain-containing protein [Parvularcula marina]RFB05087.1 DUF481 domain-containing protein [Parvularcula marina]
MRCSSVLPALILIWATPSLASEAEIKKGEDNWDGTVEFSASSATGNTENSVLGARFEAKRVLGRYSHDLKAAGDFTRTTKEVEGAKVTEETQNKWFGQYRLEVQTGDRTFAYGRARYERDVFSGYDGRAFVGGGMGHEIAIGDQFNWDVIAGPGIRHTVFIEPDSPDPEFKSEETEIAVFLGSEMDWHIRENVELEHDADATWTENNSTLESRLSLKTKITKTLSTRLAYQIKHETDPAEDREATDTQLKASVVLGF